MRRDLTLTNGGSLLCPGLSSCRAGNSRNCGLPASGVPLRVPGELSSSRPPLRLWAATTRSSRPLRAGPRAPAPPGAGTCAETWRLRRRPAVSREWSLVKHALCASARLCQHSRRKVADGRGGEIYLDDGMGSTCVRRLVKRLYKSAPCTWREFRRHKHQQSKPDASLGHVAKRSAAEQNRHPKLEGYTCSQALRTVLRWHPLHSAEPTHVHNCEVQTGDHSDTREL